jgi:hypothetical protein
MSLIMRWFYDNGERHRAFFRQVDPSQRELVIASGNWECAAPAPPESSLEDLSDDRLVEFARSWRRRGPAVRLTAASS